MIRYNVNIIELKMKSIDEFVNGIKRCRHEINESQNIIKKALSEIEKGINIQIHKQKPYKT